MTRDKLILMAHFDPGGRLGKDWRELIKMLQREDFADLVLVSTGLDATDCAGDLGDLRIIIRENVGYDFYSWRQAILDSPIDNYREAILINNSFHVVDPAKFCAVLREPVPRGRQILGLTVSWQKSFHAQSFFLQFTDEVIGSEKFKNFWRDMQPISNREAVIDNYELGFSRELCREFRIDPIMSIGDYEKFLLLRRVLKDPSVINAANLNHAYEQLKTFFNPSILLWESLLFRYGIAKKQLVHENPFGFPIDDLGRFIALGLE